MSHFGFDKRALRCISAVVYELYLRNAATVIGMQAKECGLIRIAATFEKTDSFLYLKSIELGIHERIVVNIEKHSVGALIFTENNRILMNLWTPLAASTSSENLLLSHILQRFFGSTFSIQLP